MALPAQASEELAKKHLCTTCHVVKGAKTIGPAYADVAKKYAGQKDAEAKLVDKVKKGGAGRLGPGADAAERHGARRRHQDAGEVGPVDQVSARDQRSAERAGQPALFISCGLSIIGPLFSRENP